ncbi:MULTISPECIES: hypothetical protein [Bacillales]|uniref:hypothetical protein n=1 Tax=Bacillales TaxID=1385 RepID=UPI001CD2427A|nr:hypothetical protein [Alkalihalobacillus algicola]MCA0988450.1 hypothetical protein [Alkalihalobacillus algicola]
MLDLAAVFHMATDWMVANKGYKLQSVILFGTLGVSFFSYMIWYVTKGYRAV